MDCCECVGLPFIRLGRRSVDPILLKLAMAMEFGWRGKEEEGDNHII
jgi:hypothetical protein